LILLGAFYGESSNAESSSNNGTATQAKGKIGNADSIILVCNENGKKKSGDWSIHIIYQAQSVCNMTLA